MAFPPRPNRFCLVVGAVGRPAAKVAFRHRASAPIDMGDVVALRLETEAV